MAKKASLQEMFLEEIRDLFDAEKQLLKALPRMARSVNDAELENALREHLEETKAQVQRLEQVFDMLDQRPKGKPCQGMKGIVQEGGEKIQEHDASMLDAAIAGSGRKVEHYEMAGYENARAVALQLGMRDAAQLLQQTLQEEIQADRTLAQISKRLVKEVSAGGGETAEERGGATARGASRKTRGAPAGAIVTTDHDEIRRWAEDRGAHPACVTGTGRGETCLLRLDFPGYSGKESLEEISWDEWFDVFDQKRLALLHQERTARGQRSNFNKLVSRETAARTGKPKARAAR